MNHHNYGTIRDGAERYIARPFAKLRHRLAAILRGDSPAPARHDQRASGPGERLVVGDLEVLAPADPVHGVVPLGSPAEEATSGTEPYLAALARTHETLCPELYLEIGVREGHSLRLARGPAIGIDPKMRLEGPEPTSADLYHVTSDEFFGCHADGAIGRPLDLAFIDGLHLFEYALRDFVNVERRASRCGLIIVDDIFPNHPVQASRFRRSRSWTGDVWRLLICLSEQRPDLVLLPLDCWPTGLLLIAGLDPTNRVLSEQYIPIARRYLSEYPDVPPALIHRAGALPPEDPSVHDLLDGLRRLREGGDDPQSVRSFCDGFRGRYRYPSES
jgi:hypothetical protein